MSRAPSESACSSCSRAQTDSGNEGTIHYLYAVSILWPIEMLIMYLMHRRNKNKGAEVWVQKDVGAVDLTPWKYSKLVSVIVIVCVLLVYLAFSPLGIGV